MIEFGSFRYDPGERLLYRGDDEIALPLRAVAVLESFLKRPGQIVQKDDILASAWEGAFVGEDSLTQAVSQLRSALGDHPRAPTYIQTIPKRGYRLIAEVSEPLRSASPVPQPTAEDEQAEVAHGRAEPLPGQPPTFAPGATVGRFELTARIGAGAMGEVWRARDTELQRDVAIKVVPDELADEAAVIERFRREALMLAAVNHPNIATIYGVEAAGGTRFIVMELLEGETLQERLESGALPIDDALEIAVQIARALKVAHDTSIIHRDLKPGNIMLAAGGQVKVLDFGLAKDVRSGDGAVSTDPTALSATGLPIGTAAYMSPEQAAGKPVDKRSDIFSFGCVLFEMMAGQRPFAGETPPEIVAAILKDQPDWELLPEDMSLTVRALLRRCLRKDPDRRVHDIADARIEIEEAVREPDAGMPMGGVAHAEVVPSPRALQWGLAVVAVVATTVAVWSWTRPPLEVRVSHTFVPVRSGTHLWGGHEDEDRIGGQRPSVAAMALSPDGQSIVYAATDGLTPQLYLRRLDDPLAVPIAGTDNGWNPFFSPNGESVGFFDEHGGLKTVPITGGDTKTVLANVGYGWGASWVNDETILFGGDGGIFQVPAAGGKATRLTTIDPERGEGAHSSPQLLPGREAILYTVVPALRAWEQAEIVVRELDGEPKVLLANATDARYVLSGHLVFARQGTLMAAGFDLETLKLTTDPVPVIENLMHSVGGANQSINVGAAQFSVSNSGVLVYASGGTYVPLSTEMFLVDQQGTAERVDLPDGYWGRPRFSPDDQTLAICGGNTSDRDIFLIDLATGGTIRRGHEGDQCLATWAPDGKRLAILSNHEGGINNIYVMAADGSGDLVQIAGTERSPGFGEWSSKGVFVFLQHADIWTVDVDGGGQPNVFLETSSLEFWPTFSPDGEWLAYGSDKSGQWEVYVRPYPAGDPEYQVTRGGGTRPAWSRDGTLLYYRTGDDERSKMMAVDVTTDAVFNHGAPRELFDESYVGSAPTRFYDVSRDGLFVMARSIPHPVQQVTTMHLVQNWFEELKERVPTGRVGPDRE